MAWKKFKPRGTPTTIQNSSPGEQLCEMIYELQDRVITKLTYGGNVKCYKVAPNTWRVESDGNPNDDAPSGGGGRNYNLDDLEARVAALEEKLSNINLVVNITIDNGELKASGNITLGDETQFNLGDGGGVDVDSCDEEAEA